MSDAPATDTPDQPMDDAAYQRALAVLLRVGTSIIDELATPTPEATIVARSAAFDRVALAVRRTIILSRHIAENARASISPETKRVAAREKILRDVEDAIEHRAEPTEADQLRVELVERLDSPEFDADLVHKSPAQIIRELCCDLGLANIRNVATYRRRTPDDIAILCAQAAAPAGSGLPQWLSAAIPQADKNDRASKRPPPPY